MKPRGIVTENERLQHTQGGGRGQDAMARSKGTCRPNPYPRWRHSKNHRCQDRTAVIANKNKLRAVENMPCHGAPGGCPPVQAHLAPFDKWGVGGLFVKGKVGHGSKSEATNTYCCSDGGVHLARWGGVGVCTVPLGIMNFEVSARYWFAGYGHIHKSVG